MMKHRRAEIIATLLAGIFAEAFSAYTIADEPNIGSIHWKQLFNSKDLTGWTVRSGTAKFEVDDGMIVGTTVPMSPNSFLCTDREYEDFELELEVHCDPGLNSGIQVRSQIAEEGTQVTITKNPKKPKTITLPKDRVYGYQVEIAKAESGRSGGVYDEARRFVFLDDLDGKPEAQAVFKDDQWNHIRIRCDGDRIQTWVNDVACADVRDKLDRKGTIGLQVHGNIAVTGRVIKKEYHKHQVRFRNIRIRELNDPTAASATPFSGTAVKLPGRVEMEEFDRGGEGVAYHDTEELNKGSGKLNLTKSDKEATFRRSEGVDLSYTKKPHDRFAGDVTISGEAEPPGALYLGWTKPGEWVRYSVDVQQAGYYVVSGHVSANNQNSTLELHFGGNEKCIARLPHTGSAHRWTTVRNLGSVELSSGRKMMTLKIGEVGGFNVDWLEFTLQTEAAAKTSDDKAPPNILLMVADDLGFSDLGCYGGEIETPNLDQLAENGLRLTQFYTTGRCCPSRASLLTGRYPHRVGLGHMTQDIGQSGYRGQVSDDARMIAQQLSDAGYRSFLSGKWHLGTDDPTKHGFEEFYGTLTSAKTFWDADHYLRLPAGRRSRQYAKGKFYGTDALADHAIDFLKTARETPDKPWFLYLAMNAPHFPLQAPKPLIDKYADRYVDGWDVARQQRLARMKELGIVPNGTALTPRSAYFDWGESRPANNPAWDSLNHDRQADLARRMAIYAAMVDSMDQNIGRVLNDLRESGELENTLIVFTSDNGACAEWDYFGFDIKSSPNNKLHRGDEIEEMGSPGTFHSAGSGWANVSNSPWRLYKHYNHEGGIAVPCIFHWPAGSSQRGAIDDTPSHLIDVLPTFIQAIGSGNSMSKQSPYEGDGTSLLPLLESEATVQRHLFFEHEGNRAVRDGQWKLVALRDQPWELYDMRTDRTELNNLATEHPESVARLSKAWDEWAVKNNVTQLPDDYRVAYVPARVSKKTKTEKLASGPVRKLAGGFRFTEGPAWDGDANWYFSDIPNKTLHRISEGGKVELIRTGEQASNGIVVDTEGQLIFCEVGGRRIVARSVDGKETTLADSCDGNPIGMPNDLWMSPDGGVYFTVPVTNKQRAKVVPPEAVNATVCFISPDRKTVRDVGFGLKNANGIVGSSDGKSLYVADPRSQKCFRYSIEPDGSLSNQQVAATRFSDGLTLDEHGNLYTTSKEGVRVFSPDAKEIALIQVPETPANMTFGGVDGRTLLITARTGIYAVQVRGDFKKQPVGVNKK